MSSDAVIQGREVGKVFKDFWGRPKVTALADVSFDVPKGCVFGLLGPNGAGKSTLIKLILGHLFPSTGKIAVLGAQPREVKHKAQMGYLPERSYLYKHLTATETLRYFGRLLELSEDQIDSRSDQLLDMVGLGNARNRRTGEFSHGMGRRLGLAQALLNDPDLLILDEPTAGLDPVGCREVKNLILTLGQRGKTVLLTSHLLADVEDCCQDVMVLYGGRVQSSGAMDSVLENSSRTILEFPNVSKKALSAATAALEAEAGVGGVVTTSPRQSLESYFLGIVEKSNQGDQYTGGAHMGSGVAGYLNGDAVDSKSTSPVVAELKSEKASEKSDANSATAGADEASDDGAEVDCFANTVVAPVPKPLAPPEAEAETADAEEEEAVEVRAVAKKAPSKKSASDSARDDDDDVDSDLINNLLG